MSTKIKSSNLSLNAFNEIDRRITDLIDSAYLQGIIDSDYVTSRSNANTTSFALFEHSNTISANYTISSGNNAVAAGPITIDNGVSVTVPNGSRWVIV